MTFVDTNVFMYAVGRPHPLRGRARAFFRESVAGQRNLCTSAEVLQELMHAYLPVERRQTLEAAMSLVAGSGIEVWPLEREDVELARQLHEQLPALGRARSLPPRKLPAARRHRHQDVRSGIHRGHRVNTLSDCGSGAQSSSAAGLNSATSWCWMLAGTGS